MLKPEQALEIASSVSNSGLSESTLYVLRQQHPDIHFTYCMDDDIYNGKPVVEREQFNLYLVDGREHCLCVTNNYDVATGIVLAEIVRDDE